MEDNRSYDLVILGGGAAAFAAITEASGRGLSTAIVNTGAPNRRDVRERRLCP